MRWSKRRRSLSQCTQTAFRFPSFMGPTVGGERGGACWRTICSNGSRRSCNPSGSPCGYEGRSLLWTGAVCWTHLRLAPCATSIPSSRASNRPALSDPACGTLRFWSTRRSWPVRGTATSATSRGRRLIRCGAPRAGMARQDGNATGSSGRCISPIQTRLCGPSGIDTWQKLRSNHPTPSRGRSGGSRSPSPAPRTSPHRNASAGRVCRGPFAPSERRGQPARTSATASTPLGTPGCSLSPPHAPDASRPYRLHLPGR